MPRSNEEKLISRLQLEALLSLKRRLSSTQNIVMSVKERVNHIDLSQSDKDMFDKNGEPKPTSNILENKNERERISADALRKNLGLTREGLSTRERLIVSSLLFGAYGDVEINNLEHLQMKLDEDIDHQEQRLPVIKNRKKEIDDMLVGLFNDFNENTGFKSVNSFEPHKELIKNIDGKISELADACEIKNIDQYESGLKSKIDEAITRRELQLNKEKQFQENNKKIENFQKAITECFLKGNESFNKLFVDSFKPDAKPINQMIFELRELLKTDRKVGTCNSEEIYKLLQNLHIEFEKKDNNIASAIKEKFSLDKNKLTTDKKKEIELEFLKSIIDYCNNISGALCARYDKNIFDEIKFDEKGEPSNAVDPIIVNRSSAKTMLLEYGIEKKLSTRDRIIIDAVIFAAQGDLLSNHSKSTFNTWGNLFLKYLFQEYIKSLLPELVKKFNDLPLSKEMGSVESKLGVIAKIESAIKEVRDCLKHKEVDEKWLNLFNEQLLKPRNLSKTGMFQGKRNAIISLALIFQQFRNDNKYDEKVINKQLENLCKACRSTSKSLRHHSVMADNIEKKFKLKPSEKSSERKTLI